MSPERWQQVKTVFHRTVELTPAQRPAFLSEACRGDAGLRADVEALLHSDEERASWVSKGVLEAAPELLTQDSTASRVGQSLGSYRIVREIGRGGMGAVYLAERDDDQYQGCVAIKIVKLGMETGTGAARFRREKQILAHLHHPHIARLYDGGVTPDGLPFLVMEYIEGTALDRYCAHHSLSVPERLKLFLDVCGAVSAAHRNLVVHRVPPATTVRRPPTRDGKTSPLSHDLARRAGCGRRNGDPTGAANEPFHTSQGALRCAYSIRRFPRAVPVGSETVPGT